MGNSSVGKTSIVKAYMESQSQRGREYVRTNTVQDFKRVVMVEGEDGSDCKLQLNIWDAAGDNNVKNLAHLFVNNVQCGVLVYAINSKQSFDQLMDWHEHLRNNNENCLIALVGNKSDLNDARTVSLEFGLQK